MKATIVKVTPVKGKFFREKVSGQFFSYRNWSSPMYPIETDIGEFIDNRQIEDGGYRGQKWTPPKYEEHIGKEVDFIPTDDDGMEVSLNYLGWKWMKLKYTL